MKVIFLDRDGVINKYPGDNKYVTSLKAFRFLPRAKEAIAELHRNKFKIFIISNQGGINKGIFSRETLDCITKKMLEGIRASGGHIDGVYYCIHRREENCFCRKPKTGMIDIIRKDNHIDLKNSFFIGDTIRDIDTAKAAGCKSILVLSGKEKLDNSKDWQTKPDFVFQDLYAATRFILNQKK